MPPDDYTPEILQPLAIDPASPAYQQRALVVAARLRPGVTLEQARADLQAIGQQLEREQPDTHRGWGINAFPYRWEFVGRDEPLVFTLLGLTALAVLLIGCANIASLLLARGTTRGRELAIRSALGTSRARLTRRMGIESLVLAIAGGVVGLALAYAGLRLLLATFGDAVPPFLQDRSTIDAGTLWVTLGASVLAILFFGLLPAVRHGRPQTSTLGDGLPTSGGRRLSRRRSTLVAGQVAAATLLLVVGVLLARTVVNLWAVDPGFDTRNLLLMQVSLPDSAYNTTGTAAAFYDRVLNRLTTAPNVVAAGAASRVPVAGSRLNPSRTMIIEGRPPLNDETRSVDDLTVSAGYLEALRVPVRSGRLFTPADSSGVPLVVVIGDATARRLCGGTSPLGARVRLGDESSPEMWRTVIGVVGDIRNDDVDQPPPSTVYVPAPQRPVREMTFMVRTREDPLALVPAARAAVAAEDPDLPVYRVQTMEQLLAGDLRGPTVISSMAAVFATVALLLAAVGIYGLVAYGVAQRTREIAVRMAVGAQRRDVVRTVLAGGLQAVAAGLVLGLAGGVALSQAVSVVLYRVTPTALSTYLLVAGLLLTVTVLACLAPVQRVLRLDPIAALRHE